MTAAEKVGKMSDVELYSLFTGEQFYNDPDLAKAAAQEVENREAARSGREPITIEFDRLENGTLGQCGNKTITIASDLLTKDKTNVRTPALLLEVILHEGRHDWQHMILNNPPEGMSPDMLFSLTVDRVCYISPGYTPFAIPLGTDNLNHEVFVEYSVQENEMDARYYALKRMQEIAEMIPGNEILETAIIRMQERETELIEGICSDFNEDILEKLETARKSFFKERTGKELPERLEYFKNFRIILKLIGPLIERIDELTQEGIQIERKEAIFGLYQASREAELEGIRLETPEQLVLFAMDRSFRLEQFGLEENMFRNEISRIKI